MPQLIKHFHQFGEIDGVYCTQTTAIIDFHHFMAAKKAVESPEAYAHNRFIQIDYKKDFTNSDANLKNACDMSLVYRINRKTCKEIDELKRNTEQLQQQMIEQNQIGMKATLTGLYQKLKEYHKLAQSMMQTLETAQGREEVEIKEQIYELSGIIEETQLQIDEIEKNTKI